MLGASNRRGYISGARFRPKLLKTDATHDSAKWAKEYAKRKGSNRRQSCPGKPAPRLRQPRGSRAGRRTRGGAVAPDPRFHRASEGFSSGSRLGPETLDAGRGRSGESRSEPFGRAGRRTFQAARRQVMRGSGRSSSERASVPSSEPKQSMIGRDYVLRARHHAKWHLRLLPLHSWLRQIVSPVPEIVECELCFEFSSRLEMVRDRRPHVVAIAWCLREQTRGIRHVDVVAPGGQFHCEHLGDRRAENDDAGRSKNLDRIDRTDEEALCSVIEPIR
jgi:hypothetical protein